MATTKKIELWDGYEVEVNEQLLDDFDFATELAKAEKEQDLPGIVTLYFALIGGNKVYKATREHIIEEKGFFSSSALLDIVNKINAQFPKAGSRA